MLSPTRASWAGPLKEGKTSGDVWLDVWRRLARRLETSGEAEGREAVWRHLKTSGDISHNLLEAVNFLRLLYRTGRRENADNTNRKKPTYSALNGPNPVPTRDDGPIYDEHGRRSRTGMAGDRGRAWLAGEGDERCTASPVVESRAASPAGGVDHVASISHSKVGTHGGIESPPSP